MWPTVTWAEVHLRFAVFLAEKKFSCSPGERFPFRKRLPWAKRNLIRCKSRKALTSTSRLPAYFSIIPARPTPGIAAPQILIALRDIKADEELRFDYSTTMDENRWTMTCRCGAKDCRGIVKDFHLLPTKLQQRYLRLGVVQEFIARKANHARPAGPAQ